MRQTLASLGDNDDEITATTAASVLAGRVDGSEHQRIRGSHVRIQSPFEPKILGGRACIRGMRIPVSVIVGQIAHGMTFDEVLADYPDLEREDVEQALRMRRG